MRNILLGLTFAVAGLGLLGKANASTIKKATTTGRGNGTGNNTTVTNPGRNTTVVKNSSSYNTTTVKNYGRSYYHDHGVKYSGGYYFKGQHHNHWGHRKWDGYRRCYVYWEPTIQIYYFYDEVQGGYYPCE